ncbi:MAG TPA: tetratricopeptide repeat protein [Longimicrobiales bacterium]|nr:tetratricopeptide repeat protein [Longimicrobiales bacterium]
MRAPTADLEAHDLLLRAGDLYYRFTERDLRRSIELYQAALARDSTLAAAWAGIAGAWCWLADDWLPPREAYPRAKAAALRAIALDPALAAGHSALGVVRMLYEWDAAGAEREIGRAVSLDSARGAASYDYGELLDLLGRTDSAVAYLRRARSVNPLDPQVTTRLGDFLAHAGRYAEAMAEYRQALELEPAHSLALIGMADVLLRHGKPEEALAVLGRAPEMGARVRVALARTYAALGRRAEAGRIARELERTARSRNVRADGPAIVYAALGDRDAAFRWLERAYRDRSASLVLNARSDVFAPLHADPRWPALLRRVGFIR